MSQPDLIIRGKRVVSSEPSSINQAVDKPRESGEVAASIHILDGRIVKVAAYEDVSSSCPITEAGENSIVMPGLVDTHVHINEPGRTDWEGFATATRAAAAGGVTTLVDMPLNSIPPTTTLEGMETKLTAARGQCFVDVGFWGGVIPGNTGELGPIWQAGVVGFKCFLIHSGVAEFPNVSEDNLRESMPELTRLGAVLIVHAELPGPVNSATGFECQESTAVRDRSTKYRTFLETRPRAAENEAIELMIRLSQEFGAPVHIVHHSSADALPMLRQAKESGVRITAETCPHYLHFAAEEIPDGATEYKCCPPIRERENREQLWHALSDGTIDMVVSDHSPCPPEMKLRDSGDFLKAWGGISSLQLRLPVMWTEARRRKHSFTDLCGWLCHAPARLAGLDSRKGSIAAGYDGDIVIWSPEKEFRTQPESLYHRHKLTPYAGEILHGVVEKTFLRGTLVYEQGRFHEGPSGRLLTR